MYDIDRFIISCESMKIYPSDYEYALVTEGFKDVGKAISKGAKGVWSAIVRFFTWLGKLIKNGISKVRGLFSKGNGPSAEVDEAIGDTFDDTVDKIEKAASIIKDAASDAEMIAKNPGANSSAEEELQRQASNAASIAKSAISDIPQAKEKAAQQIAASKKRDLPAVKGGGLPATQKQLPAKRGRQLPASSSQMLQIMDRLEEIQLNSCRIANKMKALTQDESKTTALTVYGNALNNVGTAVSSTLTVIMKMADGTTREYSVTDNGDTMEYAPKYNF